MCQASSIVQTPGDAELVLVPALKEHEAMMAPGQTGVGIFCSWQHRRPFSSGPSPVALVPVGSDAVNFDLIVPERLGQSWRWTELD